MSQEDIKFSFWNYLPLGHIDAEFAVDNWKKLGINLAMSFVYDPLTSKKEEMLSLLDECQKEGIRVLISDKRTVFTRLGEVSKEAFVKGLKEAYFDFGKHPATYGFFIGDEPDFEHVDDFIFAAKKVQEIMPNLTPFGNLLPYWSDKEETEKNGHSEEFYENLVHKMLSESHLPLIGFDHYTQCYDSLMDQKKGIASFLYDLRMYQKVTSEHHIPFYASLLAISHWHYRAPDENDIRWQISTAFAHGARGILWFYFHQKSLDVGFGEAPFIGEKGIIGSAYDPILREQNRFIDNYKSLLDDLAFESIFYFSKENDSSFLSKEGVEIKASRKLLAYLTSFNNVKDGRVYLMLTNGSQRYSNNFKVSLNGKVRKELWLLPGEAAFIALDELLNERR